MKVIFRCLLLIILALASASFTPFTPFSSFNGRRPPQISYRSALASRGGTKKPPFSSPPSSNSSAASPRPSHAEAGEGDYNVIFVLGGPGAGKGTQCGYIEGHFGLVHLSVGDLLREERSNPSSANAALIDSYLLNGQIVPVSISLSLVSSRMSLHPPGTTFLIDGFPRSPANLQGWSSHMRHASVSCALVYECGLAELERRIVERGRTSGRTDDNREAARKRFDTFEEQTEPVIRQLEETTALVRISAERPLGEVWEETRGVVERVLEPGVREANDRLGRAEGGAVDERIRPEFEERGKWSGAGNPLEVQVHGKTATVKGPEGTRVFERRGGWVLIHFSES